MALTTQLLLGLPTSHAETNTVENNLEASASNAYAAGRNAEAAHLGLAALKNDPGNYSLRLKVANALAWTEQYPEALRQYRALDGTPLATEGILGQANVNLWAGRPHLAAPLYLRVLETTPDQVEAKEGLAKARRQLSPRTSFRIGTIKDSDHSKRLALDVSHQWRDSSSEQIFGLSVLGGKEERLPLVQDLAPREIGFSYENLGVPLNPILRVVAQHSPTSKLFAEFGVKLFQGAVGIEIGHVNWGKLAFNPRALHDGLTANRITVASQVDTGFGRLSGNLAHFEISDGNRIEDAGMQYTPSLQPFPSSSGVKLFTGIYGHKSERDDPRYWTPTKGYYIAFLGGSWGRWESDWEAYGEIKRSALIGGEGSGGWSIGFGGKRWINKQWAVNAEGFLLDTGRADNPYRSRSFTLSIDRIW